MIQINQHHYQIPLISSILPLFLFFNFPQNSPLSIIPQFETAA